MDWFYFILVSTILSGMNSFLLKGTAIKKINKFYIAYSYACVQFGLTFLLFMFSKPKTDNFLVALGFGFGIAICFYSRLLCDLKAFEYIPTNILLPVASLNVLVVVLYGYFFLNEKIKALQFLGIIVLLTSVILINMQARKSTGNDIKNLKKGLMFGFLGIIPSSASNILNKYAVTYVDVNFISTIVLFLIVIISSTLYFAKFGKEHKALTKEHKKEVYKYSLIIGTFAFLSYVFYLNSFKIGPISLAMAISSSSIIIAVLLSAWKYKEELSLARMVYILFALTGIILIRI